MTSFKPMITHSIDWIKLIIYLLRNRGRDTFGAGDIQRITERHVIENSSSERNYTEAEAAIMESIELLRPYGVAGLTRIGPPFDGGYVGLATSIPKFVLSGGAGKNIDFEIEIAKKGAEVHIYDPSVSKLPKNHPNVLHQKVALSSSNDRRFKNSLTISEALSRFRVDTGDQFWLKLDIESSEWLLLADELHIIPRFTQLFIEFHDTYKLAEIDFRNNFLKIFRHLDKDFHLISICSNNWQGTTNYGKSFIPVTFEATFLRKDVSPSQGKIKSFTELSRLNNSRRLGIPNSPFTRLDRE